MAARPPSCHAPGRPPPEGPGGGRGALLRCQPAPGRGPSTSTVRTPGGAWTLKRVASREPSTSRSSGLQRSTTVAVGAGEGDFPGEGNAADGGRLLEEEGVAAGALEDTLQHAPADGVHPQRLAAHALHQRHLVGVHGRIRSDGLGGPGRRGRAAEQDGHQVQGREVDRQDAGDGGGGGWPGQVGALVTLVQSEGVAVGDEDLGRGAEEVEEFQVHLRRACARR